MWTITEQFTSLILASTILDGCGQLWTDFPQTAANTLPTQSATVECGAKQRVQKIVQHSTFQQALHIAQDDAVRWLGMQHATHILKFYEISKKFSAYQIASCCSNSHGGIHSDHWLTMKSHFEKLAPCRTDGRLLLPAMFFQVQSHVTQN